MDRNGPNIQRGHSIYFLNSIFDGWFDFGHNRRDILKKHEQKKSVKKDKIIHNCEENFFGVYFPVRTFFLPSSLYRLYIRYHILRETNWHNL